MPRFPVAGFARAGVSIDGAAVWERFLNNISLVFWFFFFLGGGGRERVTEISGVFSAWNGVGWWWKGSCMLNDGACDCEFVGVMMTRGVGGGGGDEGLEDGVL